MLNTNYLDPPHVCDLFGCCFQSNPESSGFSTRSCSMVGRRPIVYYSNQIDILNYVFEFSEKK